MFGKIAVVIALHAPLAVQSATFVDIPFPQTVRDHAFSGGSLFITSGNALYRYNLSNCQLRTRFTADRPLVGVDSSPDGLRTAVAIAGLSNNQAELAYNDPYGSRDLMIWSYPADFGSGSYMPVFTTQEKLLVSGSYPGSGWVNLRSFDFNTGISTSVMSVRQDSMMMKAQNAPIVALVEANISSGPLRVMSPTGTLLASTSINWFTFEVAANPTGSRFVVPTTAHMYLR
jgi:hypothetical protein